MDGLFILPGVATGPPRPNHLSALGQSNSISSWGVPNRGNFPLGDVNCQNKKIEEWDY